MGRPAVTGRPIFVCMGVHMDDDDYADEAAEPDDDPGGVDFQDEAVAEDVPTIGEECPL